MPDAVPVPGGVRRRLFLHSVPSPERALVLAGADDVVCVPRPVEPEYLGFLSALGLGPAAENVVAVPAPEGEDTMPLCERLLRLPGALDRLVCRVGDGPVSIHPHAGTPEVFAVASALATALQQPVPVHAARPRVTALLERKDLVRRRAVELGIPVADGELAELGSSHGRRRGDLEPLRLAIERQLRHTGRVLVRGACGSVRHVIGADGEQVDDALRQIAHRSSQRFYLVDVMVDATVRSTVHLIVEPDSGALRSLGVTDRRLDRGLTATGDRFPTAASTVAKMEDWALALGDWLQTAGYVGAAALDFVEYRDPGTGRPRAVFGGAPAQAREAGYLLALGRGLGAAAFVSGTVATRLRGIERLREILGRLLYDPDRGEGVIPYAGGCPEQGGCPIVAVGCGRQRASELLGKAQAALAARLTVAAGGR